MSLGQQLLILAIYVLAVARITRLINLDKIAAPLRDWVERKVTVHASIAERSSDPDTATRAQAAHHRWDVAAYFVACPWCIGFWLSLVTGILPVALIGWPWWALFPVALAASHLIGVTARFAPDDDEEFPVQSV